MAGAAEAAPQPDPGEHIPYKVLNPGEPKQLLQGNRFVDVYEVTFEGPSQQIDHVIVPVAKYNPAEVDRMIEAKLLESEGVAMLGAQPHADNLATDQ
jgi:hypothetical protein